MKDYEVCKTEDFVENFHNMVFQCKIVLVNCYSADIGTLTCHLKSKDTTNLCTVNLTTR